MRRLLGRFHTVVAVVAALALASPAAYAAVTGPDVSSWQHPGGAAINWSAVKRAGHTFAFIKATEGPGSGGTWYRNPYFDADWRGAKASGLARGAYHYAQPARPIGRTAVEQARYFVATTGTMHGPTDLPPVLDLETANGLSPAELTSWAAAWLGEVQRLTGRSPILYTYPNFWKHAMANTGALSRYRLWYASYSGSVPTPPGSWRTWTFWQHTANGTVPGIRGNTTDLNRFCCNVSTLRALANGRAASAYASNPFGRLDTVRRVPGGVQVLGWTIDPDTTAPVEVDGYIDGHLRGSTSANRPAADVARAYPGFGSGHRYAATLAVHEGQHHVCTWAINTDYGHGNPRLGCRLVTVSSSPTGNLDHVRRAVGGVLVQGWALDPDIAGPVTVHAYVDGKPVTAMDADHSRPDVAARNPGYGDRHGYEGLVAMDSTRPTHRLCTYAINAAEGHGNPVLACRTVTLSTTPFGNWETVERHSDGMHVAGWTIDPDTNMPTDVHAYVDGKPVLGMTAHFVRRDVAAAYPTYGAFHGFSGVVPWPKDGKKHRLCLYAINKGAGHTNPLLHCRTY